MDYLISVKIKNSEWYKRAEEFSGIKEFEKWDAGKTPRYTQGVSFKFAFPVQSIEKHRKSSHTIKLYRKNIENDFIELTLDNVFVIKFSGKTDGSLVISESILEQVMENKKADGKQYINCYLKDIEAHKVLPNIWLSPEHTEILKQFEYSKMIAPKIEIIAEQGTFEV